MEVKAKRFAAAVSCEVDLPSVPSSEENFKFLVYSWRLCKPYKAFTYLLGVWRAAGTGWPWNMTAGFYNVGRQFPFLLYGWSPPVLTADLRRGQPTIYMYPLIGQI